MLFNVEHHVGFVLYEDEGAGVGSVVVSVLLQYVELLELVLGDQLVNDILGSLEGGEGSASGVLAFHVVFYLSLSSLSFYLGELVLDTLGGGEGCVFSIQLHYGDLLSHSSLQAHRHDNPLKLGLGLCFLRNA